jgi:polyhydroxyalkanoate synthesis regulator phasin
MRVTWLSVGVVLLGLGVGAGLALQLQRTDELRGEVELLRDQHREVGRLQAEQARLQAAQIPAPELANLRADHAAVGRLRSEVEALRTRVRELEQPPVRP